MKPYSVFLPIALICLACVGTRQMGTLAANSTPVSFELVGEVDYFWNAKVIPGQTYELIITPYNAFGISVGDAMVTCSQRSCLLAIFGVGDEFPLEFVAPPSGEVRIGVSAASGGPQKKVGTFEIMLRAK